MKFRMTLALALFSLSTASFANSLCQEKEQDIQRNHGNGKTAQGER